MSRSATILAFKESRYAEGKRADPAAWQLTKQGKAPVRGETIGFVKVLPFKLQERQFTVKPISRANPREIDADDYVLSLHASLSQAFDPMNIKLTTIPTSLSDFI